MLNGMRTRWFALGDEVCSPEAPSQSELEAGLRWGPGPDRVSLPRHVPRGPQSLPSLPFRRPNDLFWRQDTGGATGVVWPSPSGSSGQQWTGAGGQQWTGARGQQRAGAGGRRCGPCTWLCTTLCESTYFTHLPSSSSGSLRSYGGQNDKREHNG